MAVIVSVTDAIPVKVDDPPKCIRLRVYVLVYVIVKYPVIVVELVTVLWRVNVKSDVLLIVSVCVCVDVLGYVLLDVAETVWVVESEVEVELESVFSLV